MSTSPPTVLAGILRSTRETLVERKRAIPPGELRERIGAAPPPRGFRAALQKPDIAVIAEFKRGSPSAGVLREGAEPPEIVSAYARAGARALSILTEEEHFAGSLADLSAARESCELPILRKDFVLDEYQLLEARVAGADAVLLIVAALGDRELAALHGTARELGLDVLVEVHDADELARALRLGAELIGVNNRDLRDFSVDVRRTHQLLEAIPDAVTVVSESGIASPNQLRELARERVQAVLVGEFLMRAKEPEQALRMLLDGV
ncbi:MAG TPA: indole-3-glycerol phosphate synthase TrpC [Solirubrobacteraceae bacterium]|nr:indole-3-glycerol phosphate synthase TrpC [Solirubrobacteraceae bacterium]